MSGERGPAGDHGQAGDPGRTGAKGERGPRGRAHSSFLTRNALKAYVFLLVGTIASFILSGVLYGRTTDEINRRAVETCEAGNLRSDLQREDLLDSVAQTNRLDISRLFGVDAATADEFRRLAKENADRRIARLPYIDCHTGERVPPPTTPTTTG